jgi:hypothetical protein
MLHNMPKYFLYLCAYLKSISTDEEDLNFLGWF